MLLSNPWEAVSQDEQSNSRTAIALTCIGVRSRRPEPALPRGAGRNRSPASRAGSPVRPLPLATTKRSMIHRSPSPPPPLTRSNLGGAKARSPDPLILPLSGWKILGRARSASTLRSIPRHLSLSMENSGGRTLACWTRSLRCDSNRDWNFDFSFLEATES